MSTHQLDSFLRQQHASRVVSVDVQAVADEHLETHGTHDEHADRWLVTVRTANGTPLEHRAIGSYADPVIALRAAESLAAEFRVNVRLNPAEGEGHFTNSPNFAAAA